MVLGRDEEAREILDPDKDLPVAEGRDLEEGKGQRIEGRPEEENQDYDHLGRDEEIGKPPVTKDALFHDLSAPYPIIPLSFSEVPAHCLLLSAFYFGTLLSPVFLLLIHCSPYPETVDTLRVFTLLSLSVPDLVFVGLVGSAHPTLLFDFCFLR